MYSLWIPIVIIYYVVYTYFSKYYNESGAYLIPILFMNCLPIWLLVAKWSKNLIFDALLYDILMFFAGGITLLLCGSGNYLNVHQWIGLILIISGFILMKVY
jgi:hypothetical protein